MFVLSGCLPKVIVIKDGGQQKQSEVTDEPRATATQAPTATPKADEDKTEPTSTPDATIYRKASCEDDRIEVMVRITNRWEDHYNAEVDITNVSDELIRNWSLIFKFTEEIEQIWNGEVSVQEGDNYIIRNGGWNSDIKPGETATFGMIVKYDSFKVPGECTLSE